MSREEMIANVYFMVKMDLSDEQIKALVAWFNSLWGLMTICANMEVTGGLFTRVNIAQWKLLLVLDVRGLDAGKLQCPSAVFDKYAEKDLDILSEESNNRVDLSVEVTKCLSSTQLNENKLREKIKEVQKQLVNALTTT